MILRAAFLLAAALLLAPPAAAQSRRPLAVAPGGPAAQHRPVISTEGLLRDRSLLHALESGLPLRFHFRAELWRKDVLDRLAGVQEISRAVLRAGLDEGYTLEDGQTQRRYPTLAAIESALQAAFAPTLRPVAVGRYYWIVTLEVSTLSLSDLDELRRWLRGQARPAVAGQKPVGRAVESGLRRFFVRLLGLPTRRYEVRSAAFTVP
ncbi:MAG TPA: hypothetical protein VFQ45_22320 [Longimicrobium sp.]|nr:hypothetical protein [Longimicrobium sp.]